MFSAGGEGKEGKGRGVELPWYWLLESASQPPLLIDFWTLPDLPMCDPLPRLITTNRSNFFFLHTKCEKLPFTYIWEKICHIFFQDFSRTFFKKLPVTFIWEKICHIFFKISAVLSLNMAKIIKKFHSFFKNISHWHLETGDYEVRNLSLPFHLTFFLKQKFPKNSNKIAVFLHISSKISAPLWVESNICY